MASTGYRAFAYRLPTLLIDKAPIQHWYPLNRRLGGTHSRHGHRGKQ